MIDAWQEGVSHTVRLLQYGYSNTIGLIQIYTKAGSMYAATITQAGGRLTQSND